jgi:two-component system sensor histidine kinase/response regulator
MDPAPQPLEGRASVPASLPANKPPAQIVPIERGQVNILLVDDRDDKLLALEAILEVLGHRLIKARSGQEALRLLLKHDFAVILLDVSMPTMDGFETAAVIRQRPSSETTPIIFVTAVSASSNQMYQGYSLGAVDYILAPIVPDVLRAKVSVFVDLFLKTEQLRLQAERIHRLNVELQHQVNALIDANRELESFNYSISHDLRAPLRSIQSFAQAVLEDSVSKLSPDGLDYLGRIIRSGKYMDTLLHDLLAYSRLARAEFEPSPVDLDIAVREVLNELHKDIKDKQATVEVISPLGKALGYQPIIKQIFSNLIGNALKFMATDTTPHLRISSEVVGRGVVAGTPVPEPPNAPKRLGENASPYLRVSIQDNGIGIHPEHHKKIFGLFERLHPQHTFPGTGIGLALVRKGLERLGGEVRVDSAPGRGSRFWFDLPSA